ncbi:hypothetical protein QVD17_02764 [Tagetes erecta]|uniref:Glutamate receptor n=1 Tax=Tagetes erecta TaxID=13708 RepID=A0AAD8P2R1_TARER|nr:hypothetical protein QVD17_02764 [Tagetes erecta]
MVNVIGKEEVKVGFWTTDAGFTKRIGKLTYFPEDVLETIVWPGGVVHNPMHRMLQVRSARLRIGIPKRRRIGQLFEVTYDAETNTTLVSGFCSEVFLTAFGRLDPNAAFEFIQFDGSYDDLIYQVKAGEFDAAIGDITFTANRSQYVDFTLTYTELGLATLYRNVDATTSLWIFLKPLSSDLWLVSACFFVLLGFVIWVLEHETNDEFQGSLVQQIGATLWFAFSTLVYAQRQKLESNLSRFVVTVWLFVVLVLVSSYTAALSSLLTVEQIQLLSDRGIIGYQGGSLTRVLLIRKWKFNDTRLKPYNTLEEIADALSLGSKKGGVDAIVDEIPYIKEFLARYPSGYSMITSEDYTNGFSFFKGGDNLQVFPKGSPLTLGMSTQIAGLREDGTLQKLDNKWFGQQSDQQSNDAAHALKILNFKGMRGLFLLSGATMSTALFVFTIYYIHDRLHYTYAMLAGGKGVNEPSYSRVGVILDMGSWVGKTVHSCISIAVSEFYALNTNYKTRIVLHNRDTHGEPLQALSAALDLLEKPKVQAILGSQSSAEAKFLAVLGDQARIPILSLSPISSSNKHPYFLQITQDEITQVNAIASLALSYGWKNAIIIFEDTDNERDMATFMTNYLQQKSITVTYMSSISSSANNEVLQEELHKLSNTQTKLYIVHASHSLASCLFQNAKYLGMMDVGYKWIVTSKTMNFLDFMDDDVIESMQGVVGFKSHIPRSRDLQKFTSKWRKEYHMMELKHINAYAISAYDGVSALAMAVEKTMSALKLNAKELETTRSAQWSATLLNHMLKISFNGLSGEFRFLNARVMTQVLEIVNVIDKEEVNVGFWTPDVAFTKKVGKLNSYPHDGLESIVWPGGVLNNPTHRMLRVSSRRLKIGIPKRRRGGPLFEVKYDAQTNSTHVSGFCSEVFLVAFHGFNRNITFEFIPVGGTYDDLLDQVQAGKFDAAIGDITITAKRSQYVDFTLPYTDLGYAMLFRNEATLSMWIFMEPLSSDLWIVSAFFFILLGFVIWILEHRTNDEFQGSLLQQTGTTLWFAFSTLVYAQRQKLESNLSRFVVMVWLFVVLVLVSSYTAALSSLLTVEQIQITSKEGLVGYQLGSTARDFMVQNMHSTKAMLRPLLSSEEIVDALSSGSKKGGVDVVIDEVPYIKEFLARYPSGYSMVKSKETTNGFGFVFPKGSPLTFGISTQIAGLRENGTLQELENKWFGQQSDPLSKDTATTMKVLNFKGLFLISGISMAVALFLFMLNYIHEKLHYTYARWQEESLHSS